MVLMDIPVFWKDWQKKRMKNRFEVFIFNTDSQQHALKGERTLLKSAAACFGVSKEQLDRTAVLATPKGKPYFENIDTHFSISHSGNLWACLIGPTCCGLDVQYIKPCKFNNIAGRFFSQKEAEYVKQFGLEGFYDIWTRREAYCKYTGEGFFGDIPELVDERGLLNPALQYGDRIVKFEELEYRQDLKITLCIDIKYNEDVIIRRDWRYEDYIFIG